MRKYHMVLRKNNGSDQIAWKLCISDDNEMDDFERIIESLNKDTKVNAVLEVHFSETLGMPSKSAMDVNFKDMEKFLVTQARLPEGSMFSLIEER